MTFTKVKVLNPMKAKLNKPPSTSLLCSSECSALLVAPTLRSGQS